MKPQKVFDLLFSQMEKLDRKEIDCETARAQSHLGRQVNNVVRNNVMVNNTMLAIRRHNIQHGDNLQFSGG